MDINGLIKYPELLLLILAPIFYVFMIIEWYFVNKKPTAPLSSQYRLPEVLCNFSLAAMHQTADLVAGLLIIELYFYFFNWRLFSIEMTWSYFFLLVLAQDFCYYWFHRASHRIRWMWAAHVTHHSSETMNFSTAFRQSLLYPLVGMWIFWIPLVILGFEPRWVIFSVLLNLGLQFFVHTQTIQSLGILEWILNTPSHHRVHHGRNPQYIDKNYAGVFIIWDRLFGTFEPEKERVLYGITHSVKSFNPFVVTFKEWGSMWQEVRGKGLSVRQRLSILFAPPKYLPINEQHVLEVNDRTRTLEVDVKQ
ncbi:sterol desaturase family protein [Shewanella surugensis]|uniref:Sterol desaturase family protein n=1 Tax=Shewanella surugensis TaxID=212020 RepID=A0ABT0LC63_9GAMM|nr:sterol desaturase family protein [Shewanella surugensis]MCL1125298.1 sterol desaturase family protein [Shewanella surugensis]